MAVFGHVVQANPAVTRSAITLNPGGTSTFRPFDLGREVGEAVISRAHKSPEMCLFGAMVIWREPIRSSDLVALDLVAPLFGKSRQ